MKNPFPLSLVDCQKIKENNILLPHPIGIVISEHVSLGKDCIIYQNVTIGRKEFAYSGKPKEYPCIGNNVIIYANAVIVGPINVGNNVIIGAGAVVCKNIPDNSVVVGNPAKIIKKIPIGYCKKLRESIS